MKHLEDAVKPTLTKMIQGKAIHLSADTQETVAAWAVKTALATELTYSTHQSVHSDYYQEMAQLETTPCEGISVWLAWYAGHVPEKIEARSYGLGDFIDGASSKDFLLTFRIGHFCCRIFGTDDPIRYQVFGSSQWNEGVVVIWPRTESPKRWPPQLALDDRGFEQFMTFHHRYTDEITGP